MTKTAQVSVEAPKKILLKILLSIKSPEPEDIVENSTTQLNN